MEDFLQKLKKVVRVVLYKPAISQSDYRKAGSYQLPFNKLDFHGLAKYLYRLYREIREPNLNFELGLYTPRVIRRFF